MVRQRDAHRPGRRVPGVSRSALVRVAAAAALALTTTLTTAALPSAHAAGAIVELTPTEIVFPDTQVGTQSAPRSVTLTNTGDAPLTVSDVWGSPPGSSGMFDHLVEDCSGHSLSAGESCQVDVFFEPTVNGEHTGELTFVDDAPGSPHIVRLSGVGVGSTAPSMTWSPGQLNFGTVGQYYSSPRMSLTLTSTGGSPLVVSDVDTWGWGYSHLDFFIVSDGCSGSSLPTGTSCRVEVVFRPTVADYRFGYLRFSTNAWTHHVYMNGYGAPPVADLTPGALVFGDQEGGSRSEYRTVTISNKGLGLLAVGNTWLLGADPGDFSLGNCPDFLDPGESCDLRVWFTPTAFGQRSGILQIMHNAPGTPARVPLTGNGVRTAWLNHKGPGKLFTGGDGSKVTLAVAAGGQATYQLKIVNDGPIARQFILSYAPTTASAVVHMYKPGLKRTELARYGSRGYVSPLIPAGGSSLVEMTVKPTASGQVTSGVEVGLVGSNGFVLDRFSTETNVKAPTTGTDAYGLFVKENSQPFVGGSVDGQTATAPSLAIGGVARFTARLRNDSALRTAVRFSMARAASACWSEQVTVKEGTRTVDITAQVFGSGYTRSIATRSTVPVTVVVTRVASGCGPVTYTARTSGDDAVGHTSYLLANPSV